MNSPHRDPWVPAAEVLGRIERAMFDARLPQLGREYIQSCLKNGPSRRVQNSRGNSLSRFHSRTLGIQVMLESRAGEHALAILVDADPQTICFFAQPPTLTLEIKDDRGVVKTTVRYTPDLLVVRPDGIVAEQVRDLTALSQQALDNPYQFHTDDDGHWHYRAADETLAQMGIRHRIVPNTAIPSVVVRNIRYLEDYVRDDCPAPDPVITAGLKEFIRARRFIAFHSFIAESGYSVDDFNKAVAAGSIYVDLTRDLLDASSELMLYSDAATRAAHERVADRGDEAPMPVPGTMWLRGGARISFDNRQVEVVVVGERDVAVMDNGRLSSVPLQALKNLHAAGQLEADGFVPGIDIRQLADCSPGELDRAVKRLAAVDDPKNSDFSRSTVDEFRARVASAPNRVEALLALVDKQDQRGNRTSRISSINEELLLKSLEVYNTPEAPTKKSAYRSYQMSCSEAVEESGQPVRAISYPTFCIWCEKKASILERNGKRAAYQLAPIVTSLDNAYPVHGVRPHEICYIDHTVVNLATVGPNGVDLGKPTLTLGVDGNTFQTRAMILSYDPPSTRLVLLLLRDYVRRHGRLPRVISVDNGKEFHSKELAFFCHIYGVEIRYRAPGMPRGGSLIERRFGALEEELIAQLEGNTRQMKDPRLVTKSVNPFNRSVWTLTAAYRAFQEYLFTIYPTRVHPGLGMTPDAYEAQRLAETGDRSHVLVQYDENLMLMTSPHAPRRWHTVDARRGVWVGGSWYNHPDLRRIKAGQKVEVRVEPWLHQVVYVQTGKRWIAAISSNSRRYGNRSLREIEIAQREERRLAQANGSKSNVSLSQAKSMTDLWKPMRFDDRIAQQHAEMLHLYQPLKLTYALAPAGLNEAVADVAELDIEGPASISPPPNAGVAAVSHQTARAATRGVASEAESVDEDDEMIPGYH